MDGGHGKDYEFVDGDKDALAFVAADRIKQLKLMPEKGFGAGMYEEEDNAQHESGEVAMSRAFARAQNPTARDVTPALGCDPELNHHYFMDDEMEEDDYS